MGHYIIGTAGHIDHGKTSLTKALTGVNTDRLKEEKLRNISIELGFAPLTLPNGQKVSIIDVPGHERFIRHMVSGVGGIDYVLIIIAADEGVMPQTKEHIQILQYLGIHQGMIILTKTDLVDDDWLAFIQEDIRDYLRSTPFAHSPIVPVSNRTGVGIEDLKKKIEEYMSIIPERPVNGPLRLPIDRVFHLKGSGSIVTGTIYSGSMNIGDEVEIHPSHKMTRIRQIHIHGEDAHTAVAGQRAALNLAGISLDDIQRGDVVVTPHAWKSSDRFDCHIEFGEEIEFTLKQRSDVKILIGTKELLATLILFDRREALPGDRIYAQIILREPTVLHREDRFIIRRPTPAITIGGGWVIDPLAVKHKINSETVLRIAQKAEGSLTDRILDFLSSMPVIAELKSTILAELKLNSDTIDPALQELLHDDRIQSINRNSQNYYMNVDRLNHLTEQIRQYVKTYHTQFPTRKGVNKAELTKRFIPSTPTKVANLLWDEWVSRGTLIVLKDDVSLPSFKPYVPDHWKRFEKQVESELIKDGLSVNKWSDYCQELHIATHISQELLHYFLNQDVLYSLGEDLYIHKQHFLEAKRILIHFFSQSEKLHVGDARDLFQLSRKYLIPLLECLDNHHITIRKEDFRLLHPSCQS